MIKGWQSAKRMWYIFSGIFLGLSTLCRSATLLSPIFFMVCFLFYQKTKDTIINTIFLLVAMGIIIMPWAIRNYVRFNAFIPTALGGGSSFWTGSYIPWNGDWRYYDTRDFEKVIKGSSSQIEAERKLYREGFNNIKKNPFGYIKLCIKKVYRLWFWIPGGKEVLKPYPKIKIALAIFQYLAILLGLIGILLGFEKFKDFLPLIAIILYFTIIHSLLFAIPRYNLPIIPYVLIFCASGILGILDKALRKDE